MDIDRIVEKLAETYRLTEAYNPGEKYKQENPVKYYIGKALYAPARTVGQAGMYVAKGLNKFNQTKFGKQLGLISDDPGGRHRNLSTAYNAITLGALTGSIGSKLFPAKSKVSIPIPSRPGEHLDLVTSHPSITAGAIAGAAGAGLSGYLAYNRSQYKKNWTEKEKQAAEKRYFDKIKKEEKDIDRWLNSYSDDMRKTYRSR